MAELSHDMIPIGDDEVVPHRRREIRRYGRGEEVAKPLFRWLLLLTLGALRFHEQSLGVGAEAVVPLARFVEKGRAFARGSRARLVDETRELLPALRSE